MTTLTAFAALYRQREQSPAADPVVGHLRCGGRPARRRRRASPRGFGDGRRAAGSWPGADCLCGGHQTQLRLGPPRRHRQFDPQVRGPAERPGERRVRFQPGPQLGGDPGRRPRRGRRRDGGRVHVGRHRRKPRAGPDRQRRLGDSSCWPWACSTAPPFSGPSKAYRSAQGGGEVRDEDLEARGFVARLLAKPLARVQRPRNIYVIGFLFGLGFDTATTIGLLVMATAASLAGVSPLALLALPLAFTAAMTLCDTANGVAMMRMYRLRHPQSPEAAGLQRTDHRHLRRVGPVHFVHHPGRILQRRLRPRGSA